MNKRKSVLIRINAIAIIILGCIHIAVTPIVLNMTGPFPAGQINVFLFMYVTAGAGTILPGLITLLLLPAVNRNVPAALNALKICAVYVFLLGIGAVISMSDNPFAYISLMLGALFSALAIGIKPDQEKSYESI